MSGRIEKDFVFESCVHIENHFAINAYNVQISFLIETHDIIEQNIAIDRVGHFIYNCISHSIFVNEEHEAAIQKYQDAGINVIETPGEPFDQIISMLLLGKLNAITEGRLQITDLTLGSTFGDGIRFCMIAEITEDVIDTSDNTLWWNQSSISTEHNLLNEVMTDNIVKLFGDEGWSQAGLTWPTPKAKHKLPENT